VIYIYIYRKPLIRDTAIADHWCSEIYILGNINERNEYKTLLSKNYQPERRHLTLNVDYR